MNELECRKRIFDLERPFVSWNAADGHHIVLGGTRSNGRGIADHPEEFAEWRRLRNILRNAKLKVN